MGPAFDFQILNQSMKKSFPENFQYLSEKFTAVY